MARYKWRAALAATYLIAAGFAGCGGASSSPQAAKTTIRVEGSDTMLMLAQAWAEGYSRTHPNVSMQVSGGGSGVGIASLIEGAADMANASRKMTDQERQKAKANTGQEPVETIVGYDAVAVYVHKRNPLDVISIEELAEIYGENGAITQWKQLGVQNAACQNDKITRIGRQNNSGTYRYFRKTILGPERDYKLGTIETLGSKEVIAMVSSSPCSIGYSGVEYATDEVKILRIARGKGSRGVDASLEAVESGEYPMARPLFIYTLGKPNGASKDYLDWITSEKGKQIASGLE
jgi:phosphate transport system substrate-binding protein